MSARNHYDKAMLPLWRSAALCLALLGAGQAAAAPQILVKGLVAARAGGPPSYAQCEAQFGAACFGPHDLRTAYGLNRLINAGAVGRGQTIVLIESYGSPTIYADLAAFDAGFGLPDPPSLKVLAPLGRVPYDPAKYPDQPGWAGETSLDVEWAHAMAPGAAIVVLTSPVDETEGVQGLPQFLALERYALEHHLGNIISQSWTATENTLFADAAGPGGPQIVAEFEAFYAAAARAHVTVLASAGDDGSSNPETNGSTLYPFPTVGFPASSPYVTGVGGTDLYLDPSGKYVMETVWSDAGCCAGGGGISQIFKEPAYQALALPAATQALLGGYRGVPDISYNAALANEFILIYASFPPATPGWYGVGGTSEGSPQWAGIVADLNQYAGAPLGFLNPIFYALGGAGLFGTVGRDITMGNNALTGIPGAAPGYAAGPGWDPASGWGTPNLSGLRLEALVAAAGKAWAASASGTAP